MRSTLYSNFLYALFSSFIYTTLVVQRSRILACASHFNFKFGTYISYNKNYILPIPSWNWLSDSFLFRFNLMRHIYVDYTNMSFYERLNFNPFCCTFVHFTIIVLIWYDITSYTIVLPMSIYALVLWLWSICFRCIILHHYLNCT